MATPSRTRLTTPTNSPYHRAARSPHRGRSLAPEKELSLSLKRVVGTTCASPTGFDVALSCFAYIAGGAVVVVDVDGHTYDQRFFRARPAAAPVYHTPSISPSTPTATPKANDSRNRATKPAHLGGDSWTARERIKAATCVALSREGRFLAVGETGYSPRVLIYSLKDTSSDTPLVSISEHQFGVTAVAWSADSKYLASLGSANDGFLLLWKIDAKTGAAKLFQQNRCTSQIKDMIWMGNNGLVTLGQRYVKLWRIEEAQPTSPLKQKFAGEASSPSGPHKLLPGRNVLLGDLLEATFTCGVAIDETRAILCSETGDVCILDDTAKQPRLVPVLEIRFMITCVTTRGNDVYVGGKAGNFAILDLKKLLGCDAGCIVNSKMAPDDLNGPVAIGFLEDRLVTVDTKHSIDIWSAEYDPTGHSGNDRTDVSAVDSAEVVKSFRIQISGHGDAILGVDVLPQPNKSGGSFFTWSASGAVVLWELDGRIIESFNVSLEEAYFENEAVTTNQLLVVKATKNGDFFIAGDKSGMLQVIDYKTKKCVTEMKAHTYDCQSIATLEDGSRFLMASCGRDRTAQLFHKRSDGTFAHFQTLEFAAKVVQILIPSPNRVITCSLDRTIQIHDILTKRDDPDVIGVVPTARCISLKSRPTSMALSADGKSIFVAIGDRSVYLYDLETTRLKHSFKCTDESVGESVVLDSLVTRAATATEPCLLFGSSNTDKSVRVYDANGSFLDREWGHTESITGLALVDAAYHADSWNQQGNQHPDQRSIVSVGKDGTIMIWGFQPIQQEVRPASRESSPMRKPLRRVLSKADLAELQGSPQPGMTRRPSLPSLNLAKKKSTSSLRGSGSSLNGSGSTLSMATEQACRTLKAYRKKLHSNDSISQENLDDLDQELRLTSLALGDRAKQSKAISEAILNDVLDQHSSRIIEMLEDRLRLGSQSPSGKRPESSGTLSTSDSAE